MDPSIPLLYGWVKRTRETLFEYTDSLPYEVYTLEHADFAYGSIRNIHAHVAGCYQFWLGEMGLQRRMVYADEPANRVADAKTMRAHFAGVDALLEDAMAQFNNLDEPFEVIRPRGDRLTVTQRWLIMHPITHEFHHKGQLLALGRVLGHPLPSSLDADLVLP